MTASLQTPTEEFAGSCLAIHEQDKNTMKATVANYQRDSNGAERRKRKEITLGLTATMTLRQAKRALQPILEKANASAFNPTQKQKSTTFEEFSRIWVNDYLSRSRPSTIATMRGRVKRFVAMFGRRDIRQIDGGDLQRLVAGMLNENYDSKTIRNHWITLRLILVAAFTRSYVDGLPSKPQFPPPFKKRARCFLLAEVARIIFVSKADTRVLYWLVAETGLRAGELAGLRLCDVIEGSIMTITVNQAVWNGKVGIPKTDSALRTIAVSPQLLCSCPNRSNARKPKGTTFCFRLRLAVRGT